MHFLGHYFHSPTVPASCLLKLRLVRGYIDIVDYAAQRGLPLITYASRGGGGVSTNAYKCVQGGRGGLNMTKNTHFVRRFIENATSEERSQNV